MLRARNLLGPVYQRVSQSTCTTNAGNFLGAFRCTQLPITLIDADGNLFVNGDGEALVSGSEQVCRFQERVVLADSDGNVFTDSDGAALLAGTYATVYRSA
jgi:hypothetical protein